MNFVENGVKILVFVLVAVSACSRGATTAPVPPRSERVSVQTPGAPDPRRAVEQFLNAVRAQDIQAMSVTFGTSRGPARDNIGRDELEKRLIILQCYFDHDKFRILNESPGDGGHRILSVELTRGSQTRSPRFYTIRSASGRWYVDNMEIAVVRDFCRGAARD